MEEGLTQGLQGQKTEGPAAGDPRAEGLKDGWHWISHESRQCRPSSTARGTILSVTVVVSHYNFQWINNNICVKQICIMFFLHDRPVFLAHVVLLPNTSVVVWYTHCLIMKDYYWRHRWGQNAYCCRVDRQIHGNSLIRKKYVQCTTISVSVVSKLQKFKKNTLQSLKGRWDFWMLKNKLSFTVCVFI